MPPARSSPTWRSPSAGGCGGRRPSASCSSSWADASARSACSSRRRPRSPWARRRCCCWPSTRATGRCTPPGSAAASSTPTRRRSRRSSRHSPAVRATAYVAGRGARSNRGAGVRASADRWRRAAAALARGGRRRPGVRRSSLESSGRLDRFDSECDSRHQPVAQFRHGPRPARRWRIAVGRAVRGGRSPATAGSPSPTTTRAASPTRRKPGWSAAVTTPPAICARSTARSTRSSSRASSSSTTSARSRAAPPASRTPSRMASATRSAWVTATAPAR